MKSIKLSSICGAILGASIVCSTALAQTPTPGPIPAPNDFPVPTPNPSASPPPGVQVGGVAVPVPVLNIVQYLGGGAKQDIDVADLLIPCIELRFAQAMAQLDRRGAWPC
jgi:hypothetical protein